jgi:adenylate cyclase
VSLYIGDEAVITWTPKQGIRDSNCVLVFFRMREAVAARAGHYTRRYGLVPEFKAGLHIGPVIATEVGEVKSEIVGARRLKGKANELEIVAIDGS